MPSFQIAVLIDKYTVHVHILLLAGGDNSRIIPRNFAVTVTYLGKRDLMWQSFPYWQRKTTF